MNQAPPVDPKSTIKWLNQLVMMAQWNGKLPFQFVRLYGAPQEYQKFLAQVRGKATDNTNDTDGKDQVDVKDDAEIKDEGVRTAREELLEAIGKWELLKNIFAADEDPFKDAPLDQVRLLADVSDMTTDPQRMVYSKNGTFIAVVEALRQSPKLDGERLIVDGLNKFFTLHKTNKDVTEMLYNLAEESYWHVVMASLRDGRDYTGGEEPVVAATLSEWQAKLTPDLRALLFKPGHLSRAPTPLIRMALNNVHLFNEAHESIPPERRSTDPVDAQLQIVNEALLLFKEKAAVDYGKIEAELNVLATVARHFIDVRKFAKLDGLVYTWPDVARLAMSNYEALEDVEEWLLRRQPPAVTNLDPGETRDLYELCLKKPGFVPFLRLQPRFSQINKDELRRYRPLAPVVISPTTTQAATREVSAGVDFPSPSGRDTSPPPPSLKFYENSTLGIVRDFEAEPNVISYSVQLTGSDDTIAPYKVSRSVEQLLEEVRTATGAKTDNELADSLRDLFKTSVTHVEARLTRGGAAILNQLFSAGMQSKFSSLLAHNRPLRLIVKTTEKELHYLPWEWLANVSPVQLFLSSPDHSLVRQVGPAVEGTAGALMTPLTFLSIIPSASVGQRFTSDVTIETLKDVVADQPVQYKALVKEEATLANVIKELESFKPKVVHFEGYVKLVAPDASDDAIELYLGPEEQPTSIKAFGKLLKENGVELLVVGRNGMAQIFQNLGARATFLLAESGPPIVIAPLRAIDEASATTFTTEFYRAFIQGNALESAMHIARRKLAARGGDWSVFALFSQRSNLDNFQLLRETLA